MPGMQLRGHCNRAANHGDQTLAVGIGIGIVAQQADKSNYCDLRWFCASALLNYHLPVLIDIGIVFKVIGILCKQVNGCTFRNRVK